MNRVVVPTAVKIVVLREMEVAEVASTVLGESVPSAENAEDSVEAVTEVSVAEVPAAKCSTPSVQSVEKRRKSRSNPAVPDPFTVAIASPHTVLLAAEAVGAVSTVGVEAIAGPVATSP